MLILSEHVAAVHCASGWWDRGDDASQCSSYHSKTAKGEQSMPESRHTGHGVAETDSPARRQAAGLDTSQIIDYQNLPPPVRYEELQREALSTLCTLIRLCANWTLAHRGAHVTSAAVSLKPDTFEGLRFDFQKPLNQNFVLVHR